jgi:tripartite-type tricarboxylate transporter receptor subunit TctC
MAYDPQRDLQPITLIAISALALTVHPSLPVRSVREYIALAKRRPGEVSYSTVGAGSPHHISGEWLKMASGINIIHVPFKGGGPQLTDLMGGHVQSGFIALPVLMPHVRSGRLRVIGVTSAKRSPVLPEVASIAEAGLAGFDVAQWYGMMAPAGTPAQIVDTLNSEVVAQIKSTEVHARLLELGAAPVGSSSAQFAEYIRAEITKYHKIVRATRIGVN